MNIFSCFCLDFLQMRNDSIMRIWKPNLKDVWFTNMYKDVCKMLPSCLVESVKSSSERVYCSVLHLFLCWLVLLWNYRFTTVGLRQYGLVPALFLSIPCYQCFRETMSVSTCVGLLFENLVLSYQSYFDFFTHRSTCLKTANSRCEQLVFDEKRQNGSVMNQNSRNHRSRLDTVAALHLRKGEIHKSRFSAHFFSLPINAIWEHEAVAHASPFHPGLPFTPIETNWV